VRARTAVALGAPPVIRRRRSGPTQERQPGRLGVAVLGAGKLGGDLVDRLAQRRRSLELLLVADTDASAIGVRRAREAGVPTSGRGVDAVLKQPAVELVFDATTASAHVDHAPRLRRAGKLVIDLTPAALGPCVVPLVNLTRHLDAGELSVGTSAAQALVPVARGLAWLSPLIYVEAVTVLASTALGPGGRRDMEQATTATARALEELAGAGQAKVITVVSPAEPPVPMRVTLRAVPERPVAEPEVVEAAGDAVDSLAERLPGYRLVGGPRLETKDTPWGRRTTVVLRVEVCGTGEPVRSHAGSLDLVNTVALDLGEELAGRMAPAAVPS
jgi:acetaldehyde dehydrogenase